MFKLIVKLSASITFLVLCINLHATHLVGGSMNYDYIGPGTGGTFRYKLTLKIYRDCNQTDFDPSISIGAYEAIGSNNFSLTSQFTFNLLTRQSVKPPQGTNCPGITNICLEEATYSDIITLPASTAGYHIVFLRCCRNTQNNIFDNNGQTYYAFIPPTNIQNSSPYFSGVPAPYICTNDTTTYLNGAVDPDGDSLSYRLVHPWAGADAGPPTGTVGPKPDPSMILTLPFPNVSYRSSFNSTFPFGNSGTAQIDTKNGLTTMLSPNSGQYSLAIEVTEWRNGVALSTIRRDVQIIVIGCTPNQTPVVFSSNGLYNQTVNAGETICFDITANDLDFPNQKVKISARGEVFGTEPGWQGPAAMFKNDSAVKTVTSKFCWTTSCDQGRTAPYNFVVDAIDDGCPPKYRSVAFTIEVKKFAGNISFGGPNPVCENDTGLIYFTPSPPGSKHKWTVDGGTITSPDSLTSIKVNWGAKGWGTVRVIETNNLGCVSPQREFFVEKGGYPNPIPLIKDTVCEFSGKIYQVTPTVGSKYQWLIEGGILNNKIQEHMVLVDWGSAGPGTIDIIETTRFGCISDTNYQNVDITKPLTDSIYGSQSVCPHIRGVQYSAYPPKYGSTYFWFIEGGTIVAGDSTNTITVDWGPAGIGTIKALEITKWGCVGDTFGISVIKNHVLQGFKPVGPDTMCEFTAGKKYEVVKTNGSEYFWSINGGALVQDDSTFEVMADWGKFGNAGISVYEISYDSVNNIPCIGAPVILDILLNPIPIAKEIEGRFKICEGEKDVKYSVSGFAGSSYEWFINGNSSGIRGQGTNSILIDADVVGLFNIRAIETSKDGCVGQPIDSLFRVTPKPKTKPISGDTIVCYPTFIGNPYRSGGNPGSTFNWFVNAGTIDTGNGTSDIRVSFSGQKYNTLKVVEITDEGCIGDTITKNIFADRPYLSIRYISVGFPDNYMQIAWQLDSAPLYNDFFTIQRRNAGTTLPWRTVGKVAGSILSFNDTNINTDNNAFEYRIGGKNLCGGDFYSPSHINVWLKGTQEDYDVNINWNNYEGWEGIRNYEVFRRNDAGLFHLYSRDVGTDTTDKYTDGLKNYIQRYRVKAWESIDNPDTSWSNELELKLIPILWVPNAFTPNTDGINPKFVIVSGSLKTFEIQIYDRWGRLVFETNDVDNAWDGTIDGTPLPDGVYLYKLRYTGADNMYHIKTGNITLLR